MSVAFWVLKEKKSNLMRTIWCCCQTVNEMEIMVDFVFLRLYQLLYIIY